MPSTQGKLVGTIAALHVDAVRVRHRDHDAIMSQLLKIAKLARSGELLCRAYAIRNLWFCHIEVLECTPYLLRMVVEFSKNQDLRG